MKEYTSKVIKISEDGSKIPSTFLIETFRESRKLAELKIFLLRNLDQIIEDNWGKFSKDFIVHHILRASILKIIRNANKIIAFASASYKTVEKTKVLYLEFTVVNSNFQGYNLSAKLNGDLIAEELVRGLVGRHFKPLDVVTLTRNLRVIGSLSKYSQRIYPDFREFERSGGRLGPASERTWQIAKSILRDSWNPNRKLDREGCVLSGSYEDSPWLILRKTQKHYNDSLIKMAEKYLEFSKNSDKEFILHVQFSLKSLLKYVKKIKGK